MTRIWTTALLLAASAVFSTGCVSQQTVDNLERINRQAEERRIELEQQLSELQQALAAKDAEIRSMQDQSGTNAALRARLAEEQLNVAALRDEIAALKNQIAKLGSQQQQIVVVEGLPPEVSDALRELARANANLMEYDEARGMIRLRSDLTFGLGSATVNDQAKAALGRLAGVLNGGAARSFDIQVVGHTDSVPVTSARGKQLHIDNRGLSSNRGDAVARVLQSSGVSANRLLSGGRGATQPIAPNDPKRGNQANRRVEIFLVKGSDNNAGAQAPQPGVGAQPDGGGVVEGQPEPADDSVFK